MGGIAEEVVAFLSSQASRPREGVAPDASNSPSSFMSASVLAALQRMHLFRSLNTSELERIVGSCSIVTLSSGQVLCSQGMTDQKMFLVISGSLTVGAPPGAASQIDHLDEGSATCILSLLAGRPNISTLYGGENGAIVAAVPPHALAQLETSKWVSLVEVLSGVEQPPPPVPARRGPRGRSEQLVRPFIGFALASVQAGSGGRISGLQLLLRRCARRRECESFTAWACMSRRASRVRCFADNIVSRRVAAVVADWLYVTHEGRRIKHRMEMAAAQEEIQNVREAAEIQAHNMKKELDVAYQELRASRQLEAEAAGEGGLLKRSVLSLVAECEGLANELRDRTAVLENACASLLTKERENEALRARLGMAGGGGGGDVLDLMRQAATARDNDNHRFARMDSRNSELVATVTRETGRRASTALMYPLVHTPPQCAPAPETSQEKAVDRQHQHQQLLPAAPSPSTSPIAFAKNTSTSSPLKSPSPPPVGDTNRGASSPADRRAPPFSHEVSTLTAPTFASPTALHASSPPQRPLASPVFAGNRHYPMPTPAPAPTSNGTSTCPPGHISGQSVEHLHPRPPPTEHGSFFSGRAGEAAEGRGGGGGGGGGGDGWSGADSSHMEQHRRGAVQLINGPQPLPPQSHNQQHTLNQGFGERRQPTLAAWDGASELSSPDFTETDDVSGGRYVAGGGHPALEFRVQSSGRATPSDEGASYLAMEAHSRPGSFKAQSRPGSFKEKSRLIGFVSRSVSPPAERTVILDNLGRHRATPSPDSKWRNKSAPVEGGDGIGRGWERGFTPTKEIEDRQQMAQMTPPPEWGIEAVRKRENVVEGENEGGGGKRGGFPKGGAATRTSMLREKSAAAAREKAAEQRRIHMMAQRIVMESHDRGKSQGSLQGRRGRNS